MSAVAAAISCCQQLVSRFWLGRLIVLPQVSVTGRQTVLHGVHVAVCPSSINIVKMERFLRKSCVASLAAAPMPAGGATSQQAKKRARQLGVPFEGLPGPANAITDVPGLMVGHATLTDGAGGNAVRTGVTAVLPRGHRDSTCFAGIFSLNGAGEMTGSQWVDESGMLYGPVMITNTHSVGVVRDATVKWQKQFHPGSWFGLPVVGETFDGFLSDIDGHHVREEHAWAAIESAKAGPVEEGCVGGGTGMLTARFKGGIGTSSRTVQSGSSDTFTVGVLVQSNYGGREEFRMAGVPVGAEMAGELMPIQAPEPVDSSSIPPREGSIIIVVATDAPLLPHQLTRLARRAGMGLARTGSYAGNSSGDIFIAFSTANEQTLEMTAGTGGARGGGTGPRSGSVVSHVDFLPGEHMGTIMEATAQCVEEAIANALVAADTTVGRNGNTAFALPHARLTEILKKYNRLAV